MSYIKKPSTKEIQEYNQRAVDLYQSYGWLEKGELVVLHYNDPLYNRRLHASIYSPVMKRYYPITNMGLQAKAWDEDSRFRTTPIDSRLHKMICFVLQLNSKAIKEL